MSKELPQRMCMVCRERHPKTELLRIVRTPEGEYKIDYMGKANGRGFYICHNPSCMEKLLKKKLLSKLMKTNVPDSVYEELSREYESNKNS